MSQSQTQSQTQSTQSTQSISQSTQSTQGQSTPAPVAFVRAEGDGASRFVTPQSYPVLLTHNSSPIVMTHYPAFTPSPATSSSTHLDIKVQDGSMNRPLLTAGSSSDLTHAEGAVCQSCGKEKPPVHIPLVIFSSSPLLSFVFFSLLTVILCSLKDGAKN